MIIVIYMKMEIKEIYNYQMDRLIKLQVLIKKVNKNLELIIQMTIL